MHQLRNAEPTARVANTEALPGSKKVYLPGRDGIRVPMREIDVRPTHLMNGQMETNSPVRVYDTSGPYTDPDVAIDLRMGLPELRKPWVLARGEFDVLAPSYRPPAASHQLESVSQPAADR